MNNIDDSTNPFGDLAKDLKPQLADFKRFLVKQASTFEKEVRAAAKEAISPEGKYIRPILVFLSAPQNADTASLVRRATIAELVHLSTLIHDDVIDKADMRRKTPTPFKKYGAKTAILLGDAIFSHMMSLAFAENSMDVLKKTADCVKTICEGEIKQTLSDKSKIVSRKKYYDVAYGKTAALFELACNFGATASKQSDAKWAKAAGEAGRQLGIAYQIYDDVCDWFMSEEDAGKTLGTDLISGKQTYPLIVLLEKLPRGKSAKLAKNLPSSDPAEILEMIRRFGVAEECRAEFDRRMKLAESAVAKFGGGNAGLLKFCAQMRKLKFG